MPNDATVQRSLLEISWGQRWQILRRCRLPQPIGQKLRVDRAKHLLRAIVDHIDPKQKPFWDMRLEDLFEEEQFPSSTGYELLRYLVQLRGPSRSESELHENVGIVTAEPLPNGLTRLRVHLSVLIEYCPGASPQPFETRPVAGPEIPATGQVSPMVGMISPAIGKSVRWPEYIIRKSAPVAPHPTPTS